MHSAVSILAASKGRSNGIVFALDRVTNEQMLYNSFLKCHMHHKALEVAMTKTVEAKEIPYFIKVAGCNNCKVFKSYTSLSGTEYGQDHELHAKCVHMGCDRYGHNILAPFITPMEYLRIGLNTGLRKQAVAKTKKVIARFGEFYDHRGRLKPWVVKTLSKKKNNPQ